MSRPWVKLSTQVHTDPAMMKLPREALGNWCLCLSLAGAEDNGGCLGTVADVAWHLRISEEDVVALAGLLGGRLAEVDGLLWVRDWAQWQPPTTDAERSAKSRANAQRGVVAPTNGAQRGGEHKPNPAQRGSNVAATNKNEIRQEQKRTDTPPIAPPVKPAAKASGGVATATPAPSESFTSLVTPAISQSLSGARLTGKGGKLMRWVVDVLDVLDSHSGHDAGIAVATWRAYADSDAWRFKGADPTGWCRALGDWLANGHKAQPARGGTNNPAIKADDDRTDRPLTPEERERRIAEQYARFPNLAPPGWQPPPGFVSSSAPQSAAAVAGGAP